METFLACAVKKDDSGGDQTVAGVTHVGLSPFNLSFSDVQSVGRAQQAVRVRVLQWHRKCHVRTFQAEAQ